MLLIWLYLTVFDDLIPQLQEYSTYLKEKQRHFLFTPPDYIAILYFRNANSGKVTWCNNGFRQLGVCPDFLNNDGWQAIVHPDDVDIMNKRMEIVLDGEIYQGIHRLIIDGQTLWLYNYTIPIKDKGSTYILSYNYDITQQMVLEEFLTKIPTPGQYPPSPSTISI